MNNSEAVRLCRLVAACCPQQKLDQFTADAWGSLLDGIRYADAELAVKELAKRQPFIAPSEIIAEVRRVRTKRIEEHPVIPPVGLDPDDEPAYRRWLAAARKSVGDGEIPPPLPELPPRDMKALLGAFRSVDDV